MSFIKDFIQLPVHALRTGIVLAYLVITALLGLALIGCVWWMVLKAISGVGA